MKRILRINLSNYTHEVEERDLDEWIGGVGLATQILKSELKPNVDPLSEDNIIVFAVGPFTPAYPFASKTIAMFKSPLTGNLGESHAGGRSAVTIANAGYDAIIIEGRSDRPVYLVIDNERVYFRDAGVLWGIEDSLIVGRIIAERESGRGIRTIMRIGGAGERLVRYACVTTETYRHFGRLGLGAVFGSKKLKAIVIIGKGSKSIKDLKSYWSVYNEIFKKAVETEIMKKYHLIGTSINIKPLNKIKALPTRNLSSPSFEYAEEISGEALAEHVLGRRVACSHCPTACIHIAALRLPYEEEPYFYRTLMISYDYELIYALGTMLGIGDRVGLLRLIHSVESMGLDAISTGVCLAWATEALKKGLISEKDTLIRLEFGDYENYIKAVKYIVRQPNDFYKSLSEGVENASEKYGGKEFALAFGGNEMPGYHTGPGAHIGYTIGLRHSHLDGAGYSIDQKGAYGPKTLVDILIKEEKWRQVLSSLVVCFFARGIYTPELVSRAFKALGYEYSVEDLQKIGEKIYNEKLRLKVNLGFDIEKIRIPKRIFEVETPHGYIKEEYIAEAISYFKEKVKKIVQES